MLVLFIAKSVHLVIDGVAIRRTVDSFSVPKGRFEVDKCNNQKYKSQAEFELNVWIGNWLFFDNFCVFFSDNSFNILAFVSDQRWVLAWRNIDSSCWTDSRRDKVSSLSLVFKSIFRSSIWASYFLNWSFVSMRRGSFFTWRVCYLGSSKGTLLSLSLFSGCFWLYKFLKLFFLLLLL